MIERGLIRPDGKIARAFFSPKDRLLETILGLIKAEKKQIRLACYFMTNKEILCELARARQRGVAVEVVVDKNSPFEGINIRNAGLYSHVWSRKWFGTEPIMHNKFFVFDDNIQNQSILVTGSANCTWSAQEKNEENIVVMNDKKLTAAFEKRFYQLIFFSAHLDPASWEDAKDYIDDCTQINTLHLERFAPQAYLLWQALARLCAIYLNQGLIDIFRLTDATKEQIIKQYNMITSQ
jgi:phosphatidylserine/phosphatidylglycerophosphate/cardiolipin synthase-like enzyme